MVEVIRMTLDGLVAACLLAIAAYVLVFLAVAAWTVVGARRRDPLADELDEILAGILGPRTPAGAAQPGDARRGRRR